MDKILDLILIAIILLCAWTGYKKGVIMGLGGILIIIISIYAANLVSNTFSYEVIPAMRPFVSGYMDPQIKYSVYDSLGIPYDPESGNPFNEQNDHMLSVNDLIIQNPDIAHTVGKLTYRRLGIVDSASERLATEAEKYHEASNVSLQTAIVEVLCSKAAFALGFILAFIIILTVFTVAGNILNLSFKIPNFDLLNDAGGAVLGLVTGFLFCFVIVWVLQFTGKLISEQTIAEAGITSWFMRRDVLGRYLGL